MSPRYTATTAQPAATARGTGAHLTRRGTRGLSSLVAGAVTCAVVLWMAFRAGGYFPDAYLWGGAAAFATLALLLVVAPPRYELSTPALLACAALAGLAGWTALSAHWSSQPDTALEDAQRTLAYLGIFGLALLAAGSGRYSRHLVWGLLATIAAIVIAGLISRLRPDLIDAAGTVSRFDDFRLAYPLTYWNAFGALAAMGLLLATGLASDTRTPFVLRALAAGVAVPIGTAGYLSFSRGAWLALIVGLVVLLVMGARRLNLLVSLALVGGALVLAILRLRGYPALTDDPAAGQGQLADGRGYAPFLIVLALGVAAAQGAIALLRPGVHTREQIHRMAGRAAPYLAGVLVLGALGGYVATASTVEGGAAKALERTERWVDRQWDDFMEPATFSAAGAERLTSARGTRSDLFRVAIDGFEASPFRGDGSGGYEVRFAHDRDVDEKVRDAHSLYLETLGELGLVGIVLLLMLVGAIVWAGVGARLHAGSLGRAQTGAVAAAVAVWLAHSAVDWDWQVPGLTAPALALAAALCPVGRSSRRVRRRRRSA